MTHGVDHIETGNTTSGSTWKDLLIQARKKILDDRLAQSAKKNSDSSQHLPIDYEADNVKIIDQDLFKYASKKYTPQNKDDKVLIDQCVLDFSLNTEQEQAFRIIANHSTDYNHD